MANVWEQLICQTCGSNAVEIVDGLLCCKACKSKHTLQEKISEEEVIALNRAASYRNRLAFDDAFDEYTELLKKYPDNEAANWGAFLSFYGIVYEKDTDGKYIPTCHRLSEKPVESSAYYYHFGAQHKKQAEEIEKLRVAIMDKAKKIQPYDVFICYKATEERFGMSMPTKEAAWARDVYEMLTRDLKLRVFFAEKSLQGSNIEYEPHIYSALNSAKLMFVLTTGIENVNATWVKNEWKHFSHYIKEGLDKTIRVVYDGIQPYDLPQELQKTQAIDHNAMGWDKAVKQAAESIFAVKEEKPTAKKETEVIRETVRTETTTSSNKVSNLYTIARRARDNNDSENAARYYDLILAEDPLSWEAQFYTVYYQQMQTNIANISNAVIKLSNCISSVLRLVADSSEEQEMKIKNVKEIADKIISIAELLCESAKEHYDGLSSDIKGKYTQEYIDRIFAVKDLLYNLGNQIDSVFVKEEFQVFAVRAWKRGIEKHKSVFPFLANQEPNRKEISGYLNKIGKTQQTLKDLMAEKENLIMEKNNIITKSNELWNKFHVKANDEMLSFGNVAVAIVCCIVIILSLLLMPSCGDSWWAGLLIILVVGMYPIGTIILAIEKGNAKSEAESYDKVTEGQLIKINKRLSLIENEIEEIENRLEKKTN